MYLLGDIHGDFDRLKEDVLSVVPETETILCVGDVGVGYCTYKLPPNFKFIRGNHDNPKTTKQHPNFTKDWGMVDGVFVMGGARSVDKKIRTEEINWWRDEELSYSEVKRCIEEYSDIKPDIVVSHDMPFFLHEDLVLQRWGHPDLNPFGRAKTYTMVEGMNQMLSIHRPKLWVGGHWHTSYQRVHKNTKFVVLNVFELAKIDDILG